jgi:hypothetical protein
MITFLYILALFNHDVDFRVEEEGYFHCSEKTIANRDGEEGRLFSLREKTYLGFYA